MLFSNIVDKKTLRKTQIETMNFLKKALSKSFGPYGSNSIIYKEGSLPRYTKDGHTILIVFNFLVKLNGLYLQIFRKKLEHRLLRLVTQQLLSQFFLL